MSEGPVDKLVVSLSADMRDYGVQMQNSIKLMDALGYQAKITSKDLERAAKAYKANPTAANEAALARATAAMRELTERRLLKIKLETAERESQEAHKVARLQMDEAQKLSAYKERAATRAAEIEARAALMGRLAAYKAAGGSAVNMPGGISAATYKMIKERGWLQGEQGGIDPMAAILAGGGEGGYGGSWRSGLKYSARYVGRLAAWQAGPEIGLASSTIPHLASAFGAGAALPAGVGLGAIAAVALSLKYLSDSIDATKSVVAAFGKALDETASTFVKIRGRYSAVGIRGGTETRQQMLEMQMQHQSQNTDLQMRAMSAPLAVRDIVQSWAQGQQDANNAIYTRSYNMLKEIAQKEDVLQPRREAINRWAVPYGERLSGMAEGPGKWREQLRFDQQMELEKAGQENYLRPGSVDISAIQAKHEQQNINLQNRIGQDTQSQIDAIAETRIRNTTKGVAQELLLRELQYRKEVQIAQDTGRDVNLVREKYILDQAAIQQKAQEQYKDIGQGLMDRIWLAQGGQKALLDERDMIKQLELLGKTKYEINAIIDLMRQARTSEAAQQYNNTLTSLWRRRRVARGELSPEGAAAEEYWWANPNATPEEIQALAAAYKATNISEFASRERDKLKTPQQAYKEYETSIQDAIKNNDLTKEQGAQLLEKRLGELSGRGALGQFVDMQSRWQQIQTSLLQRSDVPTMTLDEMKKAREGIDKLLSDGMPLQRK